MLKKNHCNKSFVKILNKIMAQKQENYKKIIVYKLNHNFFENQMKIFGTKIEIILKKISKF